MKNHQRKLAIKREQRQLRRLAVALFQKSQQILKRYGNLLSASVMNELKQTREALARALRGKDNIAALRQSVLRFDALAENHLSLGRILANIA